MNKDKPFVLIFSMIYLILISVIFFAVEMVDVFYYNQIQAIGIVHIFLSIITFVSAIGLFKGNIWSRYIVILSSIYWSYFHVKSFILELQNNSITNAEDLFIDLLLLIWPIVILFYVLLFYKKRNYFFRLFKTGVLSESNTINALKGR